MFTFKKFRRKGDEKERGLTGSGEVVLMEHSFLGRSGRAALSRRQSHEQQPLLSESGAAHRTACLFPWVNAHLQAVRQLGWQSP